jgi:transcriptional regulator with XRE-family HTH domain
MGHARSRPQRLAEKLLMIRNALGISQTELWKRLGVEDEIPYTRISDYELDKSEPTLMILLQYARVAGVHMEALVDDELNLPEKLPGPVKYGEIARAYGSRTRSTKRS